MLSEVESIDHNNFFAMVGDKRKVKDILKF